MNELTLSHQIAAAVAERGGCTYFVGGCVRDACMGIESKDIDLEIYGIYPETLREILTAFGGCLEKGSAFGVYGIPHCNLDIAMPRTENATGRGHRDFEVFVDPFLNTKKAAMRRDFTINAMMQNVLTGEIIDWFGGRVDLRNRIIRHVNDESFKEDALRVLRCAQFSARFGFTPANETIALCKKMDLSALPKERVAAELEKALLKAEKPSMFFRVLEACNALDVWFPEVRQLHGIPQNPVWHPEGDVYTHTMLVLDNAAKKREQASDAFAFMLSALMHDYGKIVSTFKKDGVYHAYNHEEKGIPLVKQAIKRLTNEYNILQYVVNMTSLHMKPHTVARDMSSIKVTNMMFNNAICPEDLILLADCDDMGKQCNNEIGGYNAFLLERLAIYREYLGRPYVTGADLIKAGFQPDAAFYDVLNRAHLMHLAGVDKDEALRQCVTRLNNKYKYEEK